MRQDPTIARTPPAPPRKSDACTWRTVICGTREQLVEAGIVHPAPFPGDPGQHKMAIHTAAPDGWPVWIYKKGVRFEVWRDWSEAERLAYDRAGARRKKDDAATRLRAGSPKTEIQFRQWELEILAKLLMGYRLCLASDLRGHGFGLDPASLMRFDAATADLLNAVRTGRLFRVPTTAQPEQMPPPRRPALRLVKP